MRKLFLVLLAVAVACGGGGGGDDGGDLGTASVGLQEVARGLDFPVFLTSPRGDPRLFIVEKSGRVRIVDGGTLLATPFLDLRGQVSNGSEQGLLGLAFHPDYATNGRFFASFTDPAGDNRIVAYRVSGDPNVADAASAALVLGVDQPFSNHNGGGIVFGPDGFLWIGLGDGGGAGDPGNRGQRVDELLGSLLRIDVDGSVPYAIPPGNPFVGQAGARPEIWSFGLRNPWRFAFDRETGDLYIADVGQSEREEIDFAPRSSAGGENWGWSIMEGTSCFGGGDCDRTGLSMPILDYGHGEGCSITGGAVYRGEAIAALRGNYFYGDFCSGFVRSIRVSRGSLADAREWPTLAPGGEITSFGEDAAGELYVLVASGRVLKIVPR